MHVTFGLGSATVIAIVQLTTSSYKATAFTISACYPRRQLLFNSRGSSIHTNNERVSQITKEGIEDEWDGLPIEGAHDEEFDNDEEDTFVPSSSFMTMANSIPTAALDNSSIFSSNAGKLHQDSEESYEDDLLEMGGDPSFLDDEWDGIPIEGAHDEDFEPGSGKIDATDIFVPSVNFMSMANSVPSPIIGVKDFDPLSNMGKLHKAELKDDVLLSEDDLLDIGGDPFFLDDDNNEERERKMRMELDKTNDFEWDGTVDEDAHLDFD
jgi:hypothetical protein